MYKAVFLDLDGTLLDDNKDVSQENQRAIKYVMEKGGQVYLASGRSLKATKKYWDMLNLTKYIIYANGAGIYDCHENETVFLIDIKKNICRELYDYSVNNNLCIRLDTINGRYISDEEYRVYVDEMLLDNNVMNIIDNKEILQISLLSREKRDIEDAVDYINKNISEEDIRIEDIFKTGENNRFSAINAINPKASKGNAISTLCDILKIDINDVIAFGDGINDISMIKKVGLGVAMGNAKSEVKEIAKAVTSSNNDSGVAKILLNKMEKKHIQ